LIPSAVRETSRSKGAPFKALSTRPRHCASLIVGNALVMGAKLGSDMGVTCG
jgi:hypothetical protein